MKIIIFFLGLALFLPEVQASCHFSIKPSAIQLKTQIDDQVFEDLGNELVFKLYSNSEKILEIQQEVAKQDVGHFLAVVPDRQSSPGSVELPTLETELSLEIAERDGGPLRRKKDTVLFKTGNLGLTESSFSGESASTQYFAGENDKVWVQLQITRDCSQK